MSPLCLQKIWSPYSRVLNSRIALDAVQSEAKLLERVKKLIPNAVCEINIYQIMIFRHYIVDNKHELIKIGNQT